MPNEIDELNGKANRMELDWWMSHDLFSLQWCIIVLVNLISFILFLVLIDRKRTMQITLAFMFGFTIAGFTDEFGKFFQWWSYPHEFIPFSKRSMQ
ncbi:hypothetical protein O9H85_16895 [Paenibacillus filicis]|uniref:Transmembrane protein 18 n=1 Tax=Paenibacillus gyeongsangnamensis TaxID=3388067 RepID=A0ABT4QBB8_9BACL|nr:hypothetical protein [Paenibacillus filicis]MCZ8514071.1 hypothetical protein [Paenibacillus filicis]